MDINALLSIQPYSWASIGTALFCGTIIGLERQLRGKPVGIRTSTLITLGTYIFISSSMFEFGSLSGSARVVTDPSRVIGQVITGIGFLGAGVMLAKDGMVVGVTSAATIWVLASIGVSISIGQLGAAIKLSFISVLILYGIDFLEENTKAFSRGVHAKFTASRHSGE
ncbi:MAG: putative Mg2+ transporter-C (MgtC) family protein [Halioglobus sp.]|jgi:putative Mg2+ transporter-C (MgtC) family protein